jgi:hypothetical protein
MKKVVRLTESELTKIIRSAINEESTENDACYKKWKPVLDTAVKKWKDWLNHPNTKKKWRQNWCNGQFKDPKICKDEVNIFSKYNNLLNNVRLDVNPWFVGDNTYANAGGDHILHTLFGSSVDVNINCKLMEENNDPVSLFRHEIQHIIHEIQPLNPKQQVKDVFGVKGDEYEKNFWGAGWSSKSLAKPNENISVQNIEKQFTGLGKKLYDVWNKIFMNNPSLKGDPGYACRVTEKESNIVAIRNFFGKQPGDDITYADLKPYILRQKKSTVDIYWYLACWWSQGFPNINTMLQKTNALAKNKVVPPNQNNQYLT